ncbi:MAG: class I mannose-6-phosphate isomerase [Phycisphaerales bacterium]|jgi:mannose-6-phosphate isomerase
MKPYPLKFEPIYKQRIWGGQKLRESFGKDIPADEKIGESWELADLPQDKSVIANGELAGLNINEAINKHPVEITGNENFSGNFPLLIKILDAEDVLSVQVHPDKETAKRMGKGDPKTECWYIINAAPGAAIYKGLKENVTKEQFAQAIKTGNTAELLNKVEVKPGQCHFLPSGTAHAIGAGLLIAEIQLPSDTTYRLFDWNRVDSTGKSRELHIEEAMESIHFEESLDRLPVTAVGRLVDCEFFTIDKGHQAKDCERLLSPGQMKVLMIISGKGYFTCSETNSVNFSSGDTILLPAMYEGVMVFEEESEYLIITPADSND